MIGKKSLLFLSVSLFMMNCPSATINYAMISRGNGETHWQIDNAFLSNDIRVIDIKELVKNDILYVNVLIKNGWFRPIRGKIKVEYFDENGIQLVNPWGWHPLLLESNQEEWFKFIAPKQEDQIIKIKVMIRGIAAYGMPDR